MDITVTFQNGKWVTDPNPAIVLVGTKIRWIIRAPKSEVQKLRWSILFRQGSPFSDQQFIVETRNTELQSGDRQISREVKELLDDLAVTEEVLFDHRGTTQPTDAKEAGNYKYDLRVENADTEEIVGEDDPFLFVLRGMIPVWI